ncbi:MAG: hypothetical protein P8M07_02420, partial [Flavobacteriales bacterium]|nr:hypothetical protein [Flavobacteriales bacterium]
MRFVGFKLGSKGIRGSFLTAVLLLLGSPCIGQWEQSVSGGIGTNQSMDFVASVSPVTGQFSCEVPVALIPGIRGEGYVLSLSYAGPSPDAPASWVGYGWNLGSGMIERQQNGLPDDADGLQVINISKKPDYTRLTGRITAGGEILSGLNGGIGMGHMWDSERGILPSVSLSLSAGGASISYMREAGEGIFSWGYNPVETFMYAKSLKSKSGSNSDDASDGGGEASREVV